MLELKEQHNERAILVSVRTRNISREEMEEHLDELEMLAETAGADTIFKIVQDRAKLDFTYYIGKGKAEEIAELAEMNDVSLVIFDEDLTATQVRNLEKLIDRKIIDRSGLILDIFASHAKTKEAKTQVELAQLQYMLPRLTRAWTHLQKQYGGIGTKGPGETQIETDRRLIRTKISKLKEKLEKIESQKKTTWNSRKDFLTASLVGYTNAGKSTLINLLTEANVLAEDKLFATLDSTTRAFEIEKNKKILISDTVGFIRKLPHNLIASFKSTLNVVREADFILHVIDIANPFYKEHIKVVDEMLKELNCEEKTIIKIFNKVDKLEDKNRIDYVLNNYEDSLIISAQRAINIKKLNKRLLKIYEDKYIKVEVELEITDSRLIANIHSLAEVLDTKYEEDKIYLTYKTNSINHNKIQRMIYDKN